jgi:ubiquinone/menaquinone biosynthesis C-methylase UbiE
MDPSRDPEGNEPRHLAGACQLTGSRVIEIGCGDGRLTWRYLALTRSVVGIDPEMPDLQEARKASPADARHAHFVQAEAESLPFPVQTFDVAIFGWSL